VRPLLSILIATLGSRQRKFLDLLDVLLPQAEHSGRQIEIVGLYNHGEHRLAVVRQRLLESARGTYLCFVDDDDMVSPDYVEAVGNALVGHKPDSVGFKVFLSHRAQVSTCSRVRFGQKVYGHTWDWGVMTPVRTEIAQKCRFDTYFGGRVGEDGWFKAQLLPLLGPEEFIDKVLYEYRWDAEDSTQTHLARQPRLPRPYVGSLAFRWHEWSSR
jgi:hypothetical protein